MDKTLNEMIYDIITENPGYMQELEGLGIPKLAVQDLSKRLHSHYSGYECKHADIDIMEKLLGFFLEESKHWREEAAELQKHPVG